MPQIVITACFRFFATTKEFQREQLYNAHTNKGGKSFREEIKNKFVIGAEISRSGSTDLDVIFGI